MTTEAITCPACQGQGRSYCHLNYGGRGEWKWLPCRTCEGVRTITPDHQRRLEAGKRLRDRRMVEPYRDLRAEAKRLGVSGAELSDAEWGRLPLARIEEIAAMGGERP